jgi:GNAT superfamily N-acetyltransferase
MIPRPVSAPRSASEDYSIEVVTEDDLPDLLSLMRAYCDFYGSDPPDKALLELSRALLRDSVHEGTQIIARDGSGTAVGFATIFWSWSTTRAARIGVMNDLFVAPAARGSGVAERLIGACVERCAERGARRLEWKTAPDNRRAQAVYERVGAGREQWLDYGIDLDR